MTMIHTDCTVLSVVGLLTAAPDLYGTVVIMLLAFFLLQKVHATVCIQNSNYRYTAGRALERESSTCTSRSIALK